MSSNIRLKKVCQHCEKTFIAKTTVTKFCSDDCAKRNYKKRIREQKVTTAILETNEELKQRGKKVTVDNAKRVPIENEKSTLACVQVMAELIGIGERTLYRLIKDPEFPRVKVGKRLLFNKEMVFDYFNSKSERVCEGS